MFKHTRNKLYSALKYLLHVLFIIMLVLVVELQAQIRIESTHLIRV